MSNRQIVITRQYDPDGGPPTTGQHISPYSNRYGTGANFVAAEITTTAKRGPVQMLPVQDTSHALDVPLSATQHIEMRTSAVDRAKGFLIANVPLFAAFALGVWLLSGVFALAPWFSITALVIFWLSFVLAWLVSYVYTLAVSAEGVALYESRQKWSVIREEQRRRWDYYERLGG